MGLAANHVFVRSVEELRRAGVRVLLGPGEFEPHPPRTGGAVLDRYPWDRALTAAAALLAEPQSSGKAAAPSRARPSVK